ncbi:helix-turn-helix domain-containing protein [Sphingosinicella soli]|uniref:Transcriptional regulator with XRE-family HTH domain n=1 Tax=Sphingosinicella soli TaxID=333708 RepID=A0A7W7F8D7_9SPHN|nr:XRE family transcriptional regulator [Sphingosinicella soli]MBB4633604.1 transcriptional regulator with XRE-family HTH domain [Sphingosinicella soli]
MIEQGGLGQKIKALRTAAGIPLSVMSERTGYSVSALSKMENDRLGLTYDKLTKLTNALGVDIGSLFTETPQTAAYAGGRRSVARKGEGRSINTGLYDYLYVSPELSHKRIVPIKGRVHAATLDEFGPLIRHDGEEWIYVLDGVLEVHSEFYEPEILEPGDSIYIDSRMGHAYLSRSPGGTEIIAVCTEQPGTLGYGDQLATDQNPQASAGKKRARKPRSR